jgi:hypothetical protein
MGQNHYMTVESTHHGDTNGASSGETAEVAKREITRKGLKLPQVGFEDVKPLVQAMIDLNGPSSRNLIFGQAGATATGGTADTKWAALGVFGFREKLDSGHIVSQRGCDFMSNDPATVAAAKQHALVGSGFRALIERFSTRPVNEKSLAGILHENYGVPGAKSEEAAKLLVSLATDAGLIVDGIFQAAAIEPALAAVPAASQSPKRVRGARGAAPPASAPASSERRPPAPQPPQVITQPPGDHGQAGPFGVGVEIKIEIDAKDHTPEAIGAILREVRESLTEG